MSIQFNAGQVYSTRSIGDSNCIYTWQVIKRSDSSVWIQEMSRCGELQGKVERRKITERDGVEMIYPNGKYSMAPTLRATSKDLLPTPERISLEKEYGDVRRMVNEYESMVNEIERNFKGEAAKMRIDSLGTEMGIDMLYRRAKKLAEKMKAA